MGTQLKSYTASLVHTNEVNTVSQQEVVRWSWLKTGIAFYQGRLIMFISALLRADDNDYDEGKIYKTCFKYYAQFKSVFAALTRIDSRYGQS